MFERGLSNLIMAALGDTPVVFLAGARQTGKSTLVRMVRPGEADYRTLDDLTLLAAAQADPQGFLEGLPRSVVLDEVQRVPSLFLPLKASVDRDRRPGRYILTGSANVLVLPKVSESLAGRMEVLTLWPFAQAEIAGVQPAFIEASFKGQPDRLAPAKVDRDDLVRRVLRGGYPEVLQRRSESARTRWFEAYLTTLIQRDVRDLAAIDGLGQLPHLLTTLATRAGSPLNYADLGRTLAMNQMTVKRYVALLAMLFLVVELPSWHRNLGKRLSKTPKIYLNDSGLLAHLLGLDFDGLRDQPTRLGPLLENFVVMELMKLSAWARARPALYHFRTPTGQEVDVVLENRKGELVGIEVKASATVTEADFRHLRTFMELTGDRMKSGIVLYAGERTVPFGPRLWAVPVSALWSA
jgi:uncharacterized protein